VCGIVGMLGLAKRVDTEALARATVALAHRGPDGRDAWVSPDGRVGLGHARLAVRGGAAAAQPIANEDGSIVAAVNGEFYATEALRGALIDAGHHLRTASDSELLVHLYEEGEEDAIAHLRGEFAFILWDGRRRRLWAARDRFGVKPLVWSVQGGTLFLASEAKALFAAGVSAAWDEAAVYAATRMQVVPPGRTLFRGVQSLEPGAMLLATTDGVRVLQQRYWDLDLPTEESSSEPLDDALASALDEAVRIRMESEVPVTATLSGGVDSATVVAIAARHGLRDAFGVTFGGSSRGSVHDEADDMRASANAIGVRLHEVELTPLALAEHFEASVAQAEGIAINAHVAAKNLLADAISRSGARVVLTGEGADELFHGYAHLAVDAGWTPENTATLGGMHLPDGETVPLDGVRARLGFVPTWMAAKASMGARLTGVLRPEFGDRLTDADPLAAFVDAFDVEGQLAGRAPPDVAMYLWSRSVLSESILRTLGDGTEMVHGIEGRTPFLDHELFAVARGLPPAAKRDKAALRRVARRWLPEAVVGRQKRPFLTPPLPRDWIGDLFHSEAVRTSPFFDAVALQSAWARHAETAAWEPAWMVVASLTAIGRAYRI
jgi:asparagine synthase (glutamine-hydrolysing)